MIVVARIEIRPGVIVVIVLLLVLRRSTRTCRDFLMNHWPCTLCHIRSRTITEALRWLFQAEVTAYLCINEPEQGCERHDTGFFTAQMLNL